ncbi:alpha/beta fold hydrolase [Mesobacillus subterraneus]|uniref:Alpha/beta hydrolase n=1 Tax=Mesobacillus subterraneus TaxID=285983 RepID=A0A3R9EA15_9BACI|nr:alpha/beta hydrolase [Mesobacillus subterraneus]RSD29322.1 alpha/beta hydrolase [Mesobacillus subterraneus]
MEKMAVQMKKAELPNGETLAYRERDGGTKTVLLVHGNMTSSKHWDLLMDEMDPEYKVFAVDLRGFGGSTYHKPIMSIKDFSDDVKLFVDEIGLKDFTIIGWSTGGAVGMQFAADYPGYCEKLILLASASTRGYPFFGTSAEGLPDVNNRLAGYEDVKADPGKTVAVQTAYDEENRGFLKAMWNMLIYTKHQPDERQYEEYVDDMLTQRNLAEVYHSLNTFNISAGNNGLKDGTDQVKDITIPVLILRGDRDLVVTQRMTEEIIEDFDGRARFVELKDCGHSPLVDDLNQLLEQIEGFLAE